MKSDRCTRKGAGREALDHYLPADEKRLRGSSIYMYTYIRIYDELIRPMKNGLRQQPPGKRRVEACLSFLIARYTIDISLYIHLYNTLYRYICLKKKNTKEKKTVVNKLYLYLYSHAIHTDTDTRTQTRYEIEIRVGKWSRYTRARLTCTPQLCLQLDPSALPSLPLSRRDHRPLFPRHAFRTAVSDNGKQHRLISVT